MMRFTVIVCAALLGLSACTSIRVIPPPEQIEAKLAIATEWVAPTGSKHTRQFRQLPPNVIGGTIYLANAEGEVGALDLESGDVIWQTDLNERLIAGPGYSNDTDGDILFVVNTEAQLIALKAQSGELLWRQTMSSEVLATPVAAEGRLYVQTVDGKIYALDPQTGKTVWVDGREIPALTLRGTGNPLIIDDKLLVGYANGQLVAYNAVNGEVLWEVSVAIPSGRTELERIVDIDGLFYVEDGVVYVASYQGRVLAASLQDGSVIWNREMSSYSGVNIGKQHVYLTDEQGYVWALDVNTGATLWRQDKLAERGLTAPAIMGDTVVVADAGGYVHWLSKEDGAIIGRKYLYDLYLDAFVDWGDENLEEKDYGVSAPMTVADNRLLVRDNEGSLAVFTLAGSKQ